MDSNILSRQGFSLVELSLAILITAILAGAAFYSSGKIRQTTQAQRVIEELNTIAAVSVGYYAENGAWPAHIADLRPQYLGPQASDVNPFGNAYTITPAMQGVSVSTLLPSGLLTPQSFGSEVVIRNQGGNDLVIITKSLESSIWRLKYDKKNIYKQ